MKNLLFILLTSVMIGFAEEPASGIFIVKKPGRKNPCEQELRMFIGGKKVCVFKKPLIKVEELEYVTDILYDPMMRRNHVNLGLSSSSVNILNQTVSSISKAEFAIVVDGNVIGVFSIEEKLRENFLRIGTDLQIRDLEAVRDALRKVNQK